MWLIIKIEKGHHFNSYFFKLNNKDNKIPIEEMLKENKPQANSFWAENEAVCVEGRHLIPG